MQVIADASEQRQIAGNARRFLLYFPVNSSAKCIASAADPPFPHVNNFPPLFSVSTTSPLIRSITSS